MKEEDFQYQIIIRNRDYEKELLVTKEMVEFTEPSVIGTLILNVIKELTNTV